MTFIFAEGPVLRTFQSEDTHPEPAFFVIVLARLDIQADRICQSAGYDTDGGKVTLIGSVHFRGHIADMSFDVPDTLTATARNTEKGDVARIALGIVSTNQTQQSGFAGTVLTAECPA